MNLDPGLNQFGLIEGEVAIQNPTILDGENRFEVLIASVDMGCPHFVVMAADDMVVRIMSYSTASEPDAEPLMRQSSACAGTRVPLTDGTFAQGQR